MSEAFKVGDKVRLKSDGPSMTVEEIDGGDISCAWFNGNDLKRTSFPSSALEKSDN